MLKILTVPNPILGKKTSPVKTIDQDVLNLISEMLKVCRKANGIGLAAPQVGSSHRICIINLEHLGVAPFALINPKILKKSWKKIEMEEGCLSVPGVFGMVKRPEKITIKAQSLEGRWLEMTVDGMLSRVIQHEIDHLDGVLFTSKITKLTSGEIAKQNRLD